MEDEIERTRELMMETASSKGLESSETIDISRRLDVLLNDYGSGAGAGRSGDISRCKNLSLKDGGI